MTKEQIIEVLKHCKNTSNCIGCKFYTVNHCCKAPQYAGQIHEIAMNQLDEIERLTEELEIAKGTTNRLTILDRIEIHDKAVKDTAIKCYYKMLEDCPIISDEEHEYSRFVSDYNAWLKEEFGVEME